MDKKVTLADIGKATGYSANTVSHALNGKNDVSPGTAAKIINAAREMGYVPNLFARSMRQGKSYNIAVIIPELSNLYFPILVKLMESRLRALGYDIFIMNTNENAEEELRCITTAVGKSVDGVIICPTQGSRDGLDMLKEKEIPFVLFGRNFEDDAYESVTLDEFLCGYSLTGYMISMGHRKILHLAAPFRISSSYHRRDGYVAAMKEHGLEPMVRPMDEKESVVREIKNGALDVTAVFAFSDMLALSLITSLNKAGISVPDGISVGGVDNIASHITYPIDLTSVDNRKEQMAEKVISSLLIRMEHPSWPTAHHIIPPALIQGKTVKKI